MQRFTILTTCFLTLLSFTSCCRQCADTEWVSLFNGKDLAGWSVKCLDADQGKEFWKVVDGTIEADSIGRKDHDYIWLVSDNEYADFEIELQIQAFRDSPGNSGLQVRSRWDGSPDAPNGGWLDGPQIDIHPPAPFRVGLVYDETREERRWIHPSLTDWRIEPDQGNQNVVFTYADEADNWNKMRVRCEGTRIQVWFNGDLITDYDGAGILDNEAHVLHDVGLSGHIALQLHAKDELRIRFREIFVRELP